MEYTLVDDVPKLNLQARQTELVYGKAVTIAVFGVVVAVVLAVASFLVESGLRGFFWLLCTLPVCAGYVLLADRFSRDENQTERINLWHLRILGLTLMSGCVWGLSAWFLFTHENLVFKFFLYTILASLAAVSVSAFASRFAIFAAFSVPLLGIVALETLQHSGILPFFGGFLVLLAGALLRVAWTHHLDIASMCMLETENTDLLSEVTGLKESSRVINKKQSAIHGVLDDAGVLLWRTGPDLLITHTSQRLCDLTGMQAAELRGKSIADVVQADEVNPDGYRDLVLALSQRRGFRDIDCVINKSCGSSLLVQISARPETCEKGDFCGLDGYFKDVTASGTVIRQLSFQNQHDSLTGLINREEFLNRLSVFVPPVNLRAMVPHVVYVDIRNLKLVNDTLGLAAGDEVFVELAEVLKSCIGDATLSRLGGGAFGVLLPPGELSEALQVSSHAIESLNAYRYHEKDLSFSIQARAGIAGVTPQMDTAEAVLNCAHSACRNIDEQEQNPIGVYRQGGKQVPGENATDSVVELLSSLENRSLCLQYQPVVDVASGETVWLEALLASKLTDGSIKLVGERLSEAVKHGVVLRFDRWVVDTVLREISAARSGVECGIIINLTAASMMDRQFPGYVLERIERYSVDPQRICFDVTTGDGLSDVVVAAENMKRLTSEGCKLSLDDFATAACSLESLKHLPASFVKINHVYLEDLADNNLDRMITQSIVLLAKSQNCKVIAESVQTMEMLPLLEKLGVDLAQGFALGQPASLVAASGRTSPGACATGVGSVNGTQDNVVSLPRSSRPRS